MDLNEQSVGFGDTIAKFTKMTGITKVVDTIADALGIEDCGCSKRQEILNQLIPYSINNQIEYGGESKVVQIDGNHIAVFD